MPIASTSRRRHHKETERLDVGATREVPRLGYVVLDVLVQQVDRDVLRVVGECLQMDVRMRVRGAVQHGARHIRMELGEPAHPVERDFTQAAQFVRLRVALEQGEVLAQFFLDLVVIRQPFAGNARIAQQLPRGLALGAGIVEPSSAIRRAADWAISSRTRRGSRRVLRDMIRQSYSIAAGPERGAAACRPACRRRPRAAFGPPGTAGRQLQ